MIGAWVIAWAVLASTGCRIGFDAIGVGVGDAGARTDAALVDAEIVPPDQIVLHVRDDDGAAAVGVDVLVSPLGTRLLTDATGTVQIMTTTTQRFDVVYPLPTNSWRILSAIGVPPGTAVQLGGHRDQPSQYFFQVTAPTHAAATNYDIRFREPCNQPVNYGGPSFTAGYGRQCDGATVHATMLARESSNTVYWLDGPITLTNGGTATLTGAYALAPNFMVTVNNVPGGLSAVFASAHQRDGSGLANVSIVQVDSAPTTTTTFVFPSPPADVVQVDLSPTVVSPYNYVRSKRFTAIQSGASSVVVDAAAMLPSYTSLTFDTNGRGAQWGPTTVETTASAVVYDATYFSPDQHWTAIVPRQAGSVTFPSLPADLAAAAPTEVPIAATVTTYDVPGLTSPFAIDPAIATGLSGRLPAISYYGYQLF